MVSKRKCQSFRFIAALTMVVVFAVLSMYNLPENADYDTETSSSQLHTSEPEPFRVAITIAGTFRTFDKVSESINRNLLQTLKSRHGIETRAFLNIAVDTPTSCANNCAALQSISSNVTQISAYLDEFRTLSDGVVVDYILSYDSPMNLPSPFILSWQANGAHQNIIQQFIGWQKSYELVEKYEQQVGWKFDMVARIRSDMLWVKPAPDPRTFPTDVPTLPTIYTWNPKILNGCIDDKIIFLPRNLAPAWFNMIEFFKQHASTKKWYYSYAMLTDAMLIAANMNVTQYGGSSLTEEKCGDGILAPFNYAEFAALTWRSKNCFESHVRDNWSGYSDICLEGSTTWSFPTGTSFCYHNPATDQNCPPEFVQERYFERRG